MHENESKTHTLRFDEKTQTPRLRAFKAAIPYMEPSVGKIAAIAVKMIEMKIIMDSFEDEIAVQTLERDREKLIMEAFLSHCGEEMTEFSGYVEKMLEMRKMVDMMEMMSVLNNIGDGRQEV